MEPNVLQYLKDNLYLIREGEGYIISSKFYRDTQSRASSLPIINAASNTTKPSTTISNVGNNVDSLSTTKEDYKQFIVDAEIPRYISNGYGSRFAANNFSKDGYKSWKAALEEVDYKILLAATKYYYKQTNTARVMVGNFFSQGIYESFVDDVKKAIEDRSKNMKLGSEANEDYGNILPTYLEESSSNMEQG